VVFGGIQWRVVNDPIKHQNPVGFYFSPIGQIERQLDRIFIVPQ